MGDKQEVGSCSTCLFHEMGGASSRRKVEEDQSGGGDLVFLVQPLKKLQKESRLLEGRQWISSGKDAAIAKQTKPENVVC
jgi:hypothetical protein